MRHRKAGRKLNRTGSHRLALRRNLAAALFRHGKIITTVAKAKDCRPFAERLITKAKNGSIHDRRIVAAKLRDPEAVKKLFGEIADKFRDRPGGYTSIHQLSKNRLGDNAPTAVLELVTWEPGEKPKAKRRKKAASKPKAKAPREKAQAKKPPQEPRNGEKEGQSPPEDKPDETGEKAIKGNA